MQPLLARGLAARGHSSAVRSRKASYRRGSGYSAS
jgi:hypothetical protein